MLAAQVVVASARVQGQVQILATQVIPRIVATATVDVTIQTIPTGRARPRWISGPASERIAAAPSVAIRRRWDSLGRTRS